MPCSANRDNVDNLQRQAKAMEEELEKWKESVKETRREYYELNYYTTLQLLTLREKLGTFKKSIKDAVVTPDVLALLQSISSNVDPDIVAEAVCRAVSNVPEVEVEEEQSSTASRESEALNESALTDTVMPSATSQAPPIDSFKPILTEEDLSDSQRAIMARIVSRLKCSKFLVLKAFDVCPQDENDVFDYDCWCVNNLNLDNFDDESDSDGEESSCSEVDLDSNEEDFNYSSGKL